MRNHCDACSWKWDGINFQPLVDVAWTGLKRCGGSYGGNNVRARAGYSSRTKMVNKDHCVSSWQGVDMFLMSIRDPQLILLLHHPESICQVKEQRIISMLLGLNFMPILITTLLPWLLWSYCIDGGFHHLKGRLFRHRRLIASNMYKDSAFYAITVLLTKESQSLCIYFHVRVLFL